VQKQILSLRHRPLMAARRATVLITAPTAVSIVVLMTLQIE
jgi:hypothetical protein